MPITDPPAPITPTAARRALRRQQRTARRLMRLLCAWERLPPDTPRAIRLLWLDRIGDAMADDAAARVLPERWIAAYIDDTCDVGGWMRWPDPDDDGCHAAPADRSR